MFFSYTRCYTCFHTYKKYLYLLCCQEKEIINKKKNLFLAKFGLFFKNKNNYTLDLKGLCFIYLFIYFHFLSFIYLFVVVLGGGSGGGGFLLLLFSDLFFFSILFCFTSFIFFFFFFFFFFLSWIFMPFSLINIKVAIFSNQ